jgi:hypothetical protein
VISGTVPLTDNISYMSRSGRGVPGPLPAGPGCGHTGLRPHHGLLQTFPSQVRSFFQHKNGCPAGTEKKRTTQLDPATGKITLALPRAGNVPWPLIPYLQKIVRRAVGLSKSFL